MFLPERSAPRQRQFLFAYHVTISNVGDETAQLREPALDHHRRRRRGARKCEGPGVVGEQPVLEPGTSFEYTSFCPLTTNVRHDARHLHDGPAGRRDVRSARSRRSRSPSRTRSTKWHCSDLQRHRHGPRGARRRRARGCRAGALRRCGGRAARRRSRRRRRGAKRASCSGAHRRRLLLGLVLMLVSRLAGPGAAASSKYRRRRGHRQGAPRSAAADCHRRRRGHGHSGGHVVRQLADSRRRRAARDHRHAQARAGARHAPAGALLRFDADRRAGVAHHERRRRHPQSRRHRPGAAGRRHVHRGARPRRAALRQLAADDRHDRSCWRCSAAAWRTPSGRCGRSSASAARSTPRSPAG